MPVLTDIHATRHVPSRKGSTVDMPTQFLETIAELEKTFSVDTVSLKRIANHFSSELQKGLSVSGGDIPMNVTWVMGYPTGNEQGTFLSLDMGGTNLRVCEVVLSADKGVYDITQSKYKLPDDLRTGKSDDLWAYMADCVKTFLDSHHGEGTLAHPPPLGFTFSYPCTQDYVDHGVLQRWTKGFDIDGVEGQDVVPMLEKALASRGLDIKVASLINDTTGTLIASSYTDEAVRIGCIFGTGVNAAYMENAGSIPKIAHYNLPPDTPVAINCEYGAFDSQHVILPRTKYDITIDDNSPRPNQQAFEKMSAGLYLGEIFRLVLLDLAGDDHNLIFHNQDLTKLREAYALDASVLSVIEEDPYENLSDTQAVLFERLGLRASRQEAELARRLAEIIGTRAARLSACGIAAICLKKNIPACHVGADGSVFYKYPHFKERVGQALREVLDWPDDGQPDRVVVLPAEDGSGVGAALIASLTLERAKTGFLAGIRDKNSISSIANTKGE